MARLPNSTAMIGGEPYKTDDHHANHIIEGVFFFRRFGHIGSDGTDKTVTEQNAEKCADQGRRHFVTNFFRWTAESAHGDDDAEHRRDDAQTGKGIGHGGECGDRLRGLMMVNFHVQIHHLIDVEGFDAATCGHANGVADEIPNVVVFQEFWSIGKNRAL